MRLRLRFRTPALLRLVATWLFVAVMLVAARPTPLNVSVGFVVALLGELLRIWAAGHLEKNVELATGGPYRYTRNPLYLGRLLIFTGLCLMATLPFRLHLVTLVLGYGLFFGYYLPRKERVEPARLLEVHGETYERYYRAVPSLFPSTTAYPAGSGQGWSSERMLRNREHWMLFALLLAALYLHAKAYG